MTGVILCRARGVVTWRTVTMTNQSHPNTEVSR